MYVACEYAEVNIRIMLVLHSENMIFRNISIDQIPSRCWKIDVSNFDHWHNAYNIIIGEKARKIFSDLSGPNQAIAFKIMKAFFMEITKRLSDYLPFGNELLRASRFLSPLYQQSDHYEKWVFKFVKAIPNILGDSDQSTLQVEIRLHQSLVKNAYENDVGEFWSKVDKVGKTPTLVKVAKAIFILPHGNAEVERIFSGLSDVITKKRRSLGSETIKALSVSKSVLNSKKLDSSTLKIDRQLRDSYTASHSKYEAWKQEQRKEREEKEKQKLEERLRKELNEEMNRNESIRKHATEMEDIATSLKKKEDEQRRLTSLAENALQQARKAEKDLMDLRQEKNALEMKKEAARSRALDVILKRHVHQFSDSSMPSNKYSRFDKKD